jgi:hypothetical protein
MLEDNSSESLDNDLLLSALLVQIGCLDLSRSLHKASDAWDREATFPEALGLFGQGSNCGIDENTSRERG